MTDLYHVSEFIVDSLSTLSSQVATGEAAVADQLAGYVSAMAADPARFCLEPPRRFYSEDRPDRLVPRYDRQDAREMKAQPAAMVRYSHDMEDGAAVLERARSLIQEAAATSTYDAWYRQGVGMAPTAGMYDLEACLSALADLIGQTSTNTRHAAAHLRKVAGLFVATDEAVRGAMDELRRHERSIERQLAGPPTEASQQHPPHMGRPGLVPW